MSKGFWLPIELLKDKSTTMQEKLILVEINQLSMLDKGCIASNNHFAELFGIKKESVSRSISSLENKGYITTKIKDGSRNHERTITVNKMLFEHKQNVISPLTNCLETKENKTINKTNNKYDIFLDYLKSKCKHKTKVTKTKDGKVLFNQIEDKRQLIIDYIRHQEEKKEYAAVITKFMEDYNTVYKDKYNPNNNDDEWTDGATRCDPNEYR